MQKTHMLAYFYLSSMTDNKTLAIWKKKETYFHGSIFPSTLDDIRCHTIHVHGYSLCMFRYIY